MRSQGPGVEGVAQSHPSSQPLAERNSTGPVYSVSSHWANCRAVTSLSSFMSSSISAVNCHIHLTACSSLSICSSDVADLTPTKVLSTACSYTTRALPAILSHMRPRPMIYCGVSRLTLCCCPPTSGLQYRRTRLNLFCFVVEVMLGLVVREERVVGGEARKRPQRATVSKKVVSWLLA